MSEQRSSSSSGIGFAGLLTVLFIGLKLTGYITWPWFWVVSPMLFSFTFVLLVILVLFCFAGGMACLAAMFKKLGS